MPPLLGPLDNSCSTLCIETLWSPGVTLWTLSNKFTIHLISPHPYFPQLTSLPYLPQYDSQGSRQYTPVSGSLFIENMKTHHKRRKNSRRLWTTKKVEKYKTLQIDTADTGSVSVPFKIRFLLSVCLLSPLGLLDLFCAWSGLFPTRYSLSPTLPTHTRSTPHSFDTTLLYTTLPYWRYSLPFLTPRTHNPPASSSNRLRHPPFLLAGFAFPGWIRGDSQSGAIVAIVFAVSGGGPTFSLVSFGASASLSCLHPSIILMDVLP